MIKCINLTMRYHADHALFKEVQLLLNPKHRYAITGANGAGKSTLLKILAGEEEASGGKIEKSHRSTLGLLKQDHFRYQQEKIVDVVIDGKPELIRLLQSKEALLMKADLSEEDCYQLAELEEQILHQDGYTAQSRAEKILSGLGIHTSLHHQSLSVLSGGYKLRVLLAQALFQDPDILLLDEPTNHLDIVTTAWLETFLVNQYTGLLIFVSHDRDFISNVATHILDIDYETITIYSGPYDKFLQKKAAIVEQKQQELAGKQEKIAHLQHYVDRFGASANRAKQAQSRLKMIDRIELPDIKASSRVPLNFNFVQAKPAGKLVLKVQHLTKAFTTKALFKNLHLQLSRGQKYAILGPNGVGKTTLLQTLLGQLPPSSGEIIWHENVSLGVFAQDFQTLLNPQLTIWQWLNEQVSQVPEKTIRQILGQMRFFFFFVDKKIHVLSGGECARLVFAKLILEQPNVLILDEPTNHLDMETIDGLIAGLKQFSGTLLLVSHNRYFVQQIADHLLVILPHKVDLFNGTYQEYLAKNGKDYLVKIYGEVN